MIEIQNHFPPDWSDLIAVVISVVAIILSTNATRKMTRIDVSSKLSQIKDKIRPGRLIMQDIFHTWCKKNSKNISPKSLRVQVDDKNNFIDYYNNRYHDQPSDNSQRLMANEIFTYLDELHHLWQRHLNNEFSEKEIKVWFASSLKMDTDLLMIYLEAHWKEDNQLIEKQVNRFWKNVPIIIKKAKNWEG